ncbi:MAG: PaaI family thioesterase [Pseudomonadales bacterium]|nr:PaaI family thioesterase [Pseudomonadales bacterium]MCP5183726.1 PaaI family thioesterase [Pseudomonadales bacterium]
MEPIDDHLSQIPHAAAIGMTLIQHDDNGCVVKIPYADHLVGDPDTGVVHGGAITALLDNTCGMAVRIPGVAREDVMMATLDLRIDYMAPAEPHQDILAHAVCYKRTRNIAFVRATAYQSTPDDPIATCVASFMFTGTAEGGFSGVETTP